MSKSGFGSIITRKRKNGTPMPGLYLRWYDGKKYHQRKADGTTRKHAAAHLGRIQAELEQVRAGDLDIATVADRYLLPAMESKGQAELHVEDVSRQLERFAGIIGTKPMRAITADEIMTAMQAIRRTDAEGKTRKREISAWTERHYVNALSGCFKIAIRKGFADFNPCSVVRSELSKLTKKVVPYLDEMQQARLRRACRRDVRPWLTMALETGMRLGELERLEWYDVRLEGRPTVTARKTKNGEPRTIPLTSRAADLLGKMHRARSAVPMDEPDLVLPHHLQRRSVTRLVKSAAASLGHKGFTFHDCRHVCASALMRAGVPAPTIATILGHRDNGQLVFATYGHHQPSNAAEMGMERLQSHRAETRLDAARRAEARRVAETG